MPSTIPSEISRISGNVADALTAIGQKGVTVPSGSTSDDLADLIGQIQQGGGSGGIVISDTADPAGGTVRTITAVEISGTKQITQNGVQDVTEYAAVDVNVQGGGGGGYTRTVIAPQQTVSGSTPQLTHSGAFVSGDYYVATIDGTEYICTAEPQWGGAALTIGDMTWYYGTPNEYNYPFAIGYEAGSGIMDCAIGGSGSHSVKVEHLEFPESGTTLVPKSITSNGTYNPASDNADGYSSVVVNVPSSGSNLQAKTNIAPSTSSQTIQADAGYDGLSSVQINAMPSGTAGTPTATKGTVSNHQVSVTPSVTNTSGYITGSTKTGSAVTVTASELASGNKEITANGTGIDVVGYSTVSVAVPSSSGKAGQFQSRVARTNQTTYTDMGFEITVAKAGTYNIYWTGYRSSTSSGTNGAQIYKNGATLGNAVTTFDSTYTNWQLGSLSNQTLAASDKIKIYARARNTSSYMYIANLAIIEA